MKKIKVINILVVLSIKKENFKIIRVETNGFKVEEKAGDFQITFNRADKNTKVESGEKIFEIWDNQEVTVENFKVLVNVGSS